MRHHIMETKKGPVHYWVDGKGDECLFFTHGMTLTHQIFLPQIAYFREKYTIIVWDVPAHGFSRPYKEYNQTECTQLMATILEKEDIQSAHMIGESMGGYIAQELAFHYPEKTTSLSLIGSHPLGKEDYWKIEQWLLKNAYHIIHFTPYFIMVGITVAFSGRNPVGRETTRLSITQHSKEEIQKIAKEVYRDFLSFETDLVYPSNIPVGIFYGKGDFVGRLKRINSKWAAKRGYYKKAVSQSAHNLNIDNPIAFNKEFESFLKEGIHSRSIPFESDFTDGSEIQGYVTP